MRGVHARESRAPGRAQVKPDRPRIDPGASCALCPPIYLSLFKKFPPDKVERREKKGKREENQVETLYPHFSAPASLGAPRP